MPELTKLLSLHSKLMQTIIVMTAAILLTASISLINMVDKQYDHVISKETHAWANVLAQNSTQYLARGNVDSQNELKNKLKKLITTPQINYVHIYRLNEDDNIEYFSSYNKNHNYPAISDRIAEIETLSTLRLSDDYQELIVKVIEDHHILGYLYIQTSHADKQVFIKRLVYLTLAFLLLSIIIAFSVSHWLFNKANKPLENLIDDINQVTQTKNYQTILATQPYKELDILANNINILLQRTDKHINKLIEDSQHEQIKNQALEGRLSARTDALKESNQELLSTLEKLHQFQGQLVETEKMASLGDMVAGIAHEINTPIGLGVTASSLLADKLKEIKTAFDEKTLKSSQLKKFLNDGDENIAIIFRNLERAAKLISSFKKVAVDQSSAESRTFNVCELLDEVLITLSAKLTKANVATKVNCPANLYISSKPGPLNQIFINLILNSIYHAFEGRNSGEISINIMNLSGQLHISYSDNGIGIDNTIKAKLFDPFTTTKRGSGGSGLGMHLVYNLVTQALDGHIAFESEPDKGVSFDISFPIEIARS